MTKKFFAEFPDLWDIFERQLKVQMIKELSVKDSEEADAGKAKLSAIFRKFGFNFWWSGIGSRWKVQLEEVFFEIQYYRIIKQLYEYDNLDTLATQHGDNAESSNPAKRYAEVVKPLLERRKQELMEAFAQMAAELENPLPYTWKMVVEEQETELTLGFQKRYKKSNIWNGMEGYTYSFNGRTYEDVKAFTTATVEKLPPNVSIARDTFGEPVLRRYTEIPTFDSSDREWDSAEIEYLMFDGKNVNLVVMRGGYRIANLTFYEKLLTADSRMKPVFEKLGWPMDDIVWT